MDKLSFPPQIDFHKAVGLKSHYSCRVPGEYLQRLKESCLKICEDASCDFEFFTDLQGLATISGSISCKVSLKCERCGEPFDYELCSQFMSTPDEKKAKSLKLEDKIDLIELNEDGFFELLSYLEDCLLLEIPYAPRHEEGDPACSRQGESWSYGKIEEEAHPFEALKALKGQLKQE
ncbi:MAG: YceD family protein [Succinivibrio sp.]|nr:YceD family protein [Succinivibrio sp.]